MAQSVPAPASAAPGMSAGTPCPVPVLGQRNSRDRRDVLGRHIAHDSITARRCDLIPLADALDQRLPPRRRMVHGTPDDSTTSSIQLSGFSGGACWRVGVPEHG